MPGWIAREGMLFITIIFSLPLDLKMSWLFLHPNPNNCAVAQNFKFNVILTACYSSAIVKSKNLGGRSQTLDVKRHHHVMLQAKGFGKSVTNWGMSWQKFDSSWLFYHALSQSSKEVM